MAYPAPPAKTFVLKAKRETILLVVAVTALTFGLSATVHSHRPNAQSGTVSQQAWVGDLAGVAPAGIDPGLAQPMTSASLVVSRAELELPHPPVRALVKLHGCDGTLCSARISSSAAAVTRPTAAEAASTPRSSKSASRREKPGLLARLNPLNHLPDAAALTRPFSVASDTVSGWFKRF